MRDLMGAGTGLQGGPGKGDGGKGFSGRLLCVEVWKGWRDGEMERWRFVDLDLEVSWFELDGDLIRFRDQSFLFDSNTYSI